MEACNPACCYPHATFGPKDRRPLTLIASLTPPHPPLPRGASLSFAKVVWGQTVWQVIGAPSGRAGESVSLATGSKTQLAASHMSLAPKLVAAYSPSAPMPIPCPSHSPLFPSNKVVLGQTIAQVIGAPLAAAIMLLDGRRGLAGWRWLFLLEGIPAVILAAAMW